MGASRRVRRNLQRQGIVRRRKQIARAFIAGQRAQLEEVQAAADGWDWADGDWSGANVTPVTDSSDPSGRASDG